MFFSKIYTYSPTDCSNKKIQVVQITSREGLGRILFKNIKDFQKKIFLKKK